MDTFFCSFFYLRRLGTLLVSVASLAYLSLSDISYDHTHLA